MLVRQEEETPIGDYFHDSGVFQVFNQLSNQVDEFEVDTDRINTCLDHLITNLKGLKNHVKKVETEYQKKLNQRELRDSLYRGAE